MQDDLLRGYEVLPYGVPVKLNETTYYFNREMVITGGDTKMWHWQKRLYSFLSRNARPVRDYYRLPPMQIIEVGLPIHLCPRSGSNRHWDPFKGPASANWATGAVRSER